MKILPKYFDADLKIAGAKKDVKALDAYIDFTEPTLSP